MPRMERLPDHLRGHFDAPRHVGEPEGGAHLRGEARNAACADHVVLYLRLGVPTPGSISTVEAAGFRARGCPVAMATASAACEVLPGLTADAALPEALAARFEQRFGAPRPMHRHALSLVVEALRAAALRS